MKMKTIKAVKAVIAGKFNSWIESITDKEVRQLAAANSLVTGGSIVSLLTGCEVNDYDIYFTNLQTCKRVAEYYAAQFKADSHDDLVVDVSEDGRIRMAKKEGQRGQTGGEIIPDSGAIEDAYEETEQKALNTEDEDDKPKHRPIFFSTNAITLSGKIQIVLRFYGDAEEIHKNYDFIHCTNYWMPSLTQKHGHLELNKDAMESIMTKELRYVGSKYPLCSIMRLRKFIARQWTINAGQILKMAMQLNELDLTDPKVLEDQLTGVDSAYFLKLIQDLHAKNPEKVEISYLVEIIDRIF